MQGLILGIVYAPVFFAVVWFVCILGLTPRFVTRHKGLERVVTTLLIVRGCRALS
jgi:hypothetical protein